MPTPLENRSAAALPVLLPVVEHAGRFAASRDVPYHAHPGVELVLVTEGDCECGARTGARLPGRKGSMFVLPAREAHNQRNRGFTRTTFVVFFAQPVQFDATPRVIQVPGRDPIESWMEQLCDLPTDDDPAGRTAACALLYACLERLSALERRNRTRDALHPGLARAVAHIEVHLTGAFAAGDLARQAGLSTSHLNALFRQQLGCAPLRFQQERRMRRAQALLLGPYARVNEVAAACGYEDANYFVRLFTRLVGASPGAWRNKRGRGRVAQCRRLSEAGCARNPSSS
ncbi:MAG: AraC family transcriptional regulator [bacterium]